MVAGGSFGVGATDDAGFVVAGGSFGVEATDDATTNGGAVYIVASHSFPLTSGFDIRIVETTFRNNVADGSGGGLYATRPTTTDGVPLEVTVLRSKFLSNIAGINGGAVTLINPTLVDINSPSNLYAGNSVEAIDITPSPAP